jgi:hypothetical protein
MLKLLLAAGATAVLFGQTVRTELLSDLPENAAISAVATDSAGNVFAAGSAGGGVFVANFSPDFHAIYLKFAPSDLSQVNALAFDGAGGLYLTGSTKTPRPGFGPLQPTEIGCSAPPPVTGACNTDAYVAKLDAATGETLWLTYIGGRGADAGVSLAIAGDGSILVAGTTVSTDFPVTADAAIATRPALPSGFLAQLSSDGKSLLRATYFNGAPQALALDESGAVYVTGQTSDSRPGSAGAYQEGLPRIDLMTSSDGGQSWTNLQTPSRAIWVEPDPKTPGVVYAATAGGLVRSENGGATWASFGPFDGVAVTQVRLDPTASGTLYATAITESVETSAGPSPIQAVWKSVDGGATWRKIQRMDSFDSRLWIDAAEPMTLYLTYSSNKATILSRDGGETWSGIPLPANGFVVDGLDGNRVWAGNSRGYTLFHSIDAGRTWSTATDPFRNPFTNVGSTPIFASGSTLFHTSLLFLTTAAGATYGGMRGSHDEGATWADVPGVPATAAFGDAGDPKKVYVAGPAGLFVSPDLGDTWQALRSHMDNPNVLQVAAGMDGTLYAVALPQPGAFVAKLTGDLSQTVYSTSFGDTGGVTPTVLRVDPQGRAVIGGSTTSRSLPVTIGQTALAGYGDGFVARFSADGASLDFATFLGGSWNDSLRALALAPDGEIVVAGGTPSVDFPVTADAAQREMPQGSRAAGFVAVLLPDGSLRYSSLIGGGQWGGFAAAAMSGQMLWLGGTGGAGGVPQATLTAIDITKLGQ